RAGLRGVHVDRGHARQCSLVGDESPKLEEGPGVQHSPLAFVNRSLRASTDALQVFEGNPTRSAFRRLHNGLRQTMIHILGKSPFPAAALLQEAFAGLRAFLLELLAEPAVACPYFVYVAVLSPVEWLKNSPSEVAASVMMPRSTPT